jgi:hypothetical protein
VCFHGEGMSNKGDIVRITYLQEKLKSSGYRTTCRCTSLHDRAHSCRIIQSDQTTNAAAARLDDGIGWCGAYACNAEIVRLTVIAA